MYLKISEFPTQKGFGGQGFSVYATILADPAGEKKFYSGYESKNMQEQVFQYRSGYMITNQDSVRLYHSVFMNNKKSNFVEHKYSDMYDIEGQNLMEFYFRSPYKVYSLRRGEQEHKFVSQYSIYTDYIPKERKYRDGYLLQTYSDSPLHLEYKSGYRHSRARERQRTYGCLYNNKFVSDGIYQYKSGYLDGQSFFIFSDGKTKQVRPGYEVDSNNNVSIIVPIDKSRLNIKADQKLRIFINLPPKYINYCATVDSNKKLAHIDETSGTKLIIPNVTVSTGQSEQEVTEALSKVSYLSISIYRYDTTEKDPRHVRDGITYVDDNAYDPELFSNLNLKKVDIRDESITYKDDPKQVFSDSVKFELRFSRNTQCCFDNKITINSDSSVACQIPEALIEYDIIEKEKSTEFRFSTNLNGFERKVGKIEKDSADKARP